MRYPVRKLGPMTARQSTVHPKNTRVSAVVRMPRQEVNDSLVSAAHARDPRMARVEAVLLLADEPLTARRIADAAGLTDTADANKVVDALRRCYESDGSAFELIEIAGGFQLFTRPEYHPWLVRLRRTGHDARLTPSALETLAVIAYKQPITRAELEKLRGVNCADLLRVLMEKALVRIAGRHSSLGRPQLYGTTNKFLQVFGLNTLADLPEAEGLPRPA